MIGMEHMLFLVVVALALALVAQGLVLAWACHQAQTSARGALTQLAQLVDTAGWKGLATAHPRQPATGEPAPRTDLPDEMPYLRPQARQRWSKPPDGVEPGAL